MTTPGKRPENRPKNREVEDEMVCPAAKQGEPPRPATEPVQPDSRDESGVDTQS